MAAQEQPGSTRESQRTSFGSQVDAAEYDTYRPGYPDRVVDWILDQPTRPLRVVDLGAGTGKLTQVLLDRGHQPVAVEPSEPMLARLADLYPDVEQHVGSGEDIPLPDASADAVIVAQAWHWLDEERACAEIARVLKPGGTLGIIWNARDESADWVKELNDAAGRQRAVEEAATPRPHRPQLTDAFGELEQQILENGHALPSVDALVGLASTWSYVQLAADPAAALRRVRDIASTQAHDDGTVVMPQNTVAYRARKV